MSETTLRSLRLALASLLAAALVSRLAIVMSRNEMPPVELLGSFTVLSNILATTMLTALAVRPSLGDSVKFAWFRGATTVYMAVTALLFGARLAFPDLIPHTTEPWVDWTLGLVGPLTVVTDWLVHPPTSPVTSTAAMIWALPPVLYLVYTLVRGTITGAYPYRVLDPGEAGGYVGVSIWSVAAIIVTLSVALACRWWSARQTRTTRTA